MLATIDFGKIRIVNRHYADVNARRECFRYDGNGDYNNFVTTSAGQVFAIVQLFNGAIVAYRVTEWEEWKNEKGTDSKKTCGAVYQASTG